MEKSIEHTAKNVAHEVAHAEKSVAKDIRHVVGQVEHAAKKVGKSVENSVKNVAHEVSHAVDKEVKNQEQAVKQMKTAISKYTESMMAFGKHVGKDIADSKVAKGVENLAKHPLKTGEALLSVVGGAAETVGGTVFGLATSETVAGDLASIFNGNLSKVGTHNFAENMAKKYGGQAGDVAYLAVSTGLGLTTAPEAELSKVKDLVNVTRSDIKFAAQGGKRLLQTVRSTLDNGGESKLALAGVGRRETVSVVGVKQTASKSNGSLIKSGEHAGANGTEAVAAKGTGNGITKDEYKNLRKKTPSNDIRKMVNPDGPKVDPVYGYEVDKFEADHIVSMKEITEMDGFSRLTREQQIEILNLKDNFAGLGKSSNAFKGAHSWADWKGHSKMGEVPVNVRMEMLEKEKQAREALNVAIEERLR
ncbi:hypothetical protein [Neobacillus sp. PS3-40]|uniref:hypothetical protein n=1 Tax=Neobacillus sp. PS3-40 TaxID=3070679 RepID=UPI0027DFE5B0|nr:hypothetical protein [Neobacillus sp. PS3-40]WML45903.1 hypothetical protein RCG20_08475 [Neobacillus sp. PS3-40]